MRIDGEAEADSPASEDGIGGVVGHRDQVAHQGMVIVTQGQGGYGRKFADGSSWEGVYDKWRSWLETCAVEAVEIVGGLVEKAVECCVRGLRAVEAAAPLFFWLIAP